MRHHSWQHTSSVLTAGSGLACKDDMTFKVLIGSALTYLLLSLSASLDHIPYGTVTGAA